MLLWGYTTAHPERRTQLHFHAANRAVMPLTARQMCAHADERTFDPMHEPAVSCTVIRARREVKRVQPRQTDFPAAMAVALVARVSWMRTPAGISIGRGRTPPGTRGDLRHSRKRPSYGAVEEAAPEFGADRQPLAEAGLG